MFREKVTNMYKECPSCNTFFIGSSLSLRHVNPMLFDSLVNHNKDYSKTTSYNLGSIQVVLLEAMYLAEHSIKNKIIPANSTLFVELRPHSINDSIFTAKNTFYRDFQDLKLVTAHEQNLFNKVSVVYSSIAQYLFNYINGGALSTLNKDYATEQLKKNGIRGFLPHKVSLKSRDKHIPIKHREKRYNYDCNAIILRKLKYINEIAHLHRIQLIYLVPSLLFEESSDWKIHLIHSLEKDSSLQIIDMGQPQRYPELFDPAQYHDKIHLHKDGANLYTQRLAEAYLELEK